jgi:hypothetical protein
VPPSAFKCDHINKFYDIFWSSYLETEEIARYFALESFGGARVVIVLVSLQVSPEIITKIRKDRRP